MRKIAGLSLLASLVSVISFAQNSIGGIINNYTEVLSYSPCDNALVVANASAFKAGDTVLLIQMKGARIDSSNTAAFGNVVDYRNAGNYEFNFVSQVTGNLVALRNKLTRTYDISDGLVQLVRVPFYRSAVVNTPLTAMPWDGSKGGILVFNVEQTLTLQSDIDVSGKGFRGGQGKNTSLRATNCQTNTFYHPNNTVVAALKGESIAMVGQDKSCGKGALAAGGGGGLDHNSGGGGGGNATPGGLGGYQLYECSNSYFDNRGIGGKALTYNNVANKIYLGSGGGAGHCNNQYENPAANANFSGGNGGGIILINANILVSNGHKLISNGNTAYELQTSADVAHDGIGGGGAGGTVLLSIANYSDASFIDVKGGKGGDMFANLSGGHIGPGGGGAGGVVWFSQAALPAGVTVTSSGGRGGVLVLENNNSYGTSPGSAGLNVFGLRVPVDVELFKKNIDSVKINDSIKNCTAVDFKGVAFTNTSPVTSWQWIYANGAIVSYGQNLSIDYGNPGNFSIKLVVTDINGCRDSVTKTVTIGSINVKTGNDTLVCSGSRVQLNATGATSYRWNPTTDLSNPEIANPVATPRTTTEYIVYGMLANGCEGQDTVVIATHPLPSIAKTSDTTICSNTPAPLFVTGGISYEWLPAATLSNAFIANPVATPQSATTYFVRVTDAYTCRHWDSVKVEVRSKSQFAAKPDTSICAGSMVTLQASGGEVYNWSPAISLSDAASPNPVAMPNITTVYAVRISESLCNYDSTFEVTVTVNPTPDVRAQKSNDIDCSSPTSQLMAIGAASYLWAPADGLDHPDRYNPIASLDTTTTFFVTGIDRNGCIGGDTIRVNVTKDNIPIYNMPNAFTPNHDGKNDCFGIRKWGVATLLEFSIYNRWGQMVFTTSDASQCWDGTYRGKNQDAGGYAYVIRARTFCGEVKRTGMVLLIR